MKFNSEITLLFAPDEHPLAKGLVQRMDMEMGKLETRQFPDGESYLRISSYVQDRDCMILVDMSHPDSKYLPMIFLADTLRELGARSVGLVCPYLPYMRQDRRFVPGEAVSSRLFARMISAHFDWLVTVDPHLHRYASLEKIYPIPATVVQAAPELASWLKDNRNLLLVGPDQESEQWVSEIATLSGHPFAIATKTRYGDRDVRIELPDLSGYHRRKAVIIDDVISTGQTVEECMKALRAQKFHHISCAAIHGIFAEGSDIRLHKAGLKDIVTCNTIVHDSNSIDVGELLVAPIQAQLARLHASSGREQEPVAG